MQKGAKSLSKQQGTGEETEVNPVQEETGFNSQYLFILQYNCSRHVTSILGSIYTVFLGLPRNVVIEE